ncbi:MAG: hypothetical protein RIR36_1436 [Bacteroidota bacterium]
MFVQQLYTGCISESAYYIESNGIAAIIDPLRDIDAYLQLAKQRSMGQIQLQNLKLPLQKTIKFFR